MSRKQKILVGTDDSPGANRALNEATDLAARLGAELIIVYVQPSHLTEDLERLRFIEHASMDEILKAASLEILGRAKDGAKEIGATNVRIVLGAGDPASFILQLAEREQVDFVVVGKRGRGQLAGLLIGSVSQKLASLASCKVVIVP